MPNTRSSQTRPRNRPPRILALSSAGGHFVQLLRLLPALDGCEVEVATTDPGLRSEMNSAAAACGLPQPGFHVVTEANRWQKFRLVRSALDILMLLVRVRPDVLITTGAAPGFIALRLAALGRIRTVWIDSLANAEALSLSGSRAGRHADLWLTQWPHLSRPDGPDYAGSVL